MNWLVYIINRRGAEDTKPDGWNFGVIASNVTWFKVIMPKFQPSGLVSSAPPTLYNTLILVSNIDQPLLQLPALADEAMLEYLLTRLGVAGYIRYGHGCPLLTHTEQTMSSATETKHRMCMCPTLVIVLCSRKASAGQCRKLLKKCYRYNLDLRCFWMTAVGIFILSQMW